MTRLPILAATAMIAIAACSTTQQQYGTAPDISKIEARRMSEDALKDLVFSQLGEVLSEYPRPQSRQRPKHPLSDLSYWTKPRAADTPNLCKYDRVRIHFTEPIGQPENASARVRANGVEANSYYFLVGEMEPDDAYSLQVKDRPKLDAKCAGYSPFDVDSIYAGQEDLLVAVINWADEIASKNAADLAMIFEQSCKPNGSSAPAGCIEDILKALSAAPTSTDFCAGKGWETEYPFCAQADFGDIRFRFYSTAYLGVPALIETDELIILSHERID